MKGKNYELLPFTYLLLFIYKKTAFNDELLFVTFVNFFEHVFNTIISTLYYQWNYVYYTNNWNSSAYVCIHIFTGIRITYRQRSYKYFYKKKKKTNYKKKLVK